jgi:hypothetical protein
VNKYVAILLVLISCTPTKHYRKVASDPNVTPKKKAIIAPFVSAHFPVKERIVSDTVRIVDTVYDEKTTYILSTIIDSLIMRKQDTVRIRDRKAEAKLIAQLNEIKKDCGRLITIHEKITDTIYQEDEAKTFAMREYITRLESKNSTLSYDLEVADKRVGSANRRVALMTVLFVVCLLLLILMIYLLLKPKR